MRPDRSTESTPPCRHCPSRTTAWRDRGTRASARSCRRARRSPSSCKPDEAEDEAEQREAGEDDPPVRESNVEPQNVDTRMRTRAVFGGLAILRAHDQSRNVRSSSPGSGCRGCWRGTPASRPGSRTDRRTIRDIATTPCAEPRHVVDAVVDRTTDVVVAVRAQDRATRTRSRARCSGCGIGRVRSVPLRHLLVVPMDLELAGDAPTPPPRSPARRSTGTRCAPGARRGSPCRTC